MLAPGRQIVVNSDDFGMSEEVNNAIFEAHDRGVVSSTTLLICGPAVDHALEGARQRPRLGVGIHLDTSEFPPLSASFAALRERTPELDLRTARRVTPTMARAVFDEWQAQIAAARNLGVELSHLDAHHFDHVNPLLLPVLAKVIRSSGVTKVRGMHNLWVDEPSRLVVGVKSIHRSALRSLGATTTDHMCDVGSFLTLAAERRLPSTGSFELMSHPGHPSYANETQRLHADGPEIFVDRLVNWTQLVP